MKKTTSPASERGKKQPELHGEGVAVFGHPLYDSQKVLRPSNSIVSRERILKQRNLWWREGKHHE